MANNALARIESALRERKLDRTLTTALAPLERSDAAGRLDGAIGSSAQLEKAAANIKAEVSMFHG